MSIKIMQPNQRITIQDKGFLKGDDGGYYIPYIDEEGFLSWTPSDEGMEEVAGANVKGRDSVYIGAEEPKDDDVLIWLNPDGKPTPDGLVTVEIVNQLIEESKENSLTEDKVSNLIASYTEQFVKENEVSELIASSTKNFVTNEDVIEIINNYPIAEEVLW